MRVNFNPLLLILIKIIESGETNMRRFIVFLLLAAALIFPTVTSCYPSGYEGKDKNPSRPAENQVDKEALEEEGAAPAEEPEGTSTPTETPTESPTDAPTDDSGGE